MSDKKVAIVLGGTVPHCELIKQLQQRGFYVILIDYLTNSPAKNFADEHIQESTLDQEKVLEIALERKAALVISACVDQANITACYVMEKMGLYVPYSYETALKVTNKGSMKKIMLDNNIPTSKYVYITDINEADSLDLNYPVMVKPADSNSANGVKKAKNIDEMKEYLNDALQISRNHKAIVEECITGNEISAYCYIRDHKAHLLMTAERLSVYDGSDEVIKCYASVAPAQISKKAEKRAEDIATAIAEAFDLNDTPLFFQGMVSGDEVNVIEFAPRTGGGSCFKTIKGNTGFDIISASIDSWMNIPVNFDSWHYPGSLYVVNTVYGKDGVYDHIEGIEAMKNEGVIEDLLQIRVKGDVIDNSRASSSRICFFIIKAENFDDLMIKNRKAFDLIDVLNDKGESILRPEMSIFNLYKK